MAGLRVVLDTNVLVSALAYPGSIPGRILNACREGELDLVLSRYILDEMARVLPRLKRIKLTSAEIRDLADSFLFLAQIVEPCSTPEATLRDPADQLVLGTLRASQADYLVTGDKDLLALGERYPIVTPAIFWERHGR
ncbi:MAG: putative toxin-antitoxin system toxin component, PIN family [Terracidiphilus sp.]|jgi:putative PIN family toxin of toxin-antitoxin system